MRRWSDRPVAFVAGLPRSVRMGDHELRLVVVSFLTVSVEHKNRGYGILVWSELVRRAREAGFDGVVNYCVEGEAMNRMIEGSCRRLGLPVVRVYTVEYLSKVLWPKRDSAEKSHARLPVEQFIAVASRATGDCPLARIWTDAEAEWQLRRLGAVRAEAAAGSRSGLAGGYVIPVANRDRTPCLIVDDILWADLGAAEREVVVRDLVGAASAAGARLAVVPVQGYADIQPFVEAGFRPSRTRIHAYLTVWSRPVPDEPLSSYYLDVI